MQDAVTRLNAALADRYRIERQLGEGGMATVYLADDLRHPRKVALKVLKPELAAVVGSERFLAEIRTTAALQHPHILPLFDSGEAGGLLFYVMPRVEGESLRDRLDRQHQLPVDDAVAIATNVAEALDYAHRHGVIHRDIKPANILLLDGKPVVSDFGIALAVSSSAAGRMTETGLSLGTPHYMSPEQATGDTSVGPATDIWALGCVLYEMLVGEPPYTGGTPQAILGKIITAAPSSAIEARKSIPPNVDAAIRKALEKVPADRFGNAGDFARAVVDRRFTHGLEPSAVAPTSGALAWKRLALATSLSTLVLTAALAFLLTRGEPPSAVERYPMPFMPGQEPPANLLANSFDLSRDGTTLVYPRQEEGSLATLWVRRWDESTAVAIDGTAGVQGISISPDGQRVAFAESGVIKTVDLTGGPVVTLGDGTAPYWGTDGHVYARVPGVGAVRFPESGGEPEIVSALDLDSGRRVHALLPGGRALLVVNSTEGLEIHILDLDGGESELLVAGEQPRYARSGHLLYLVDGTLMAAPFDARRARLTGPAVPIEDGVFYYSISETGKLFYTEGTGGGAPVQPVWVTRSGEVTIVDPSWRFDRADNNEAWSLSPDDAWLAVRELTEDGFDIFVKQLDQGARSRLTFDVGQDRAPVWLADGRTVLFLGRDEPFYGVFSRPIDGSSPAQLLVPGAAIGAGTITFTASSSGEHMLFQIGNSNASPDIFALEVGKDSIATPTVAATNFGMRKPELSADGRWFAYVSNENGRDEVYARAFPGAGSRQWPISRQGGTAPKWSRDGREVFFLGADRAMYVVDVGRGDGLSPSTPRRLFQLPDEIDVAGIDFTYDVSVDAQRFIMTRTISAGESGPVEPPILVNNFFEELRRLAPVD